jgi:hypothetical protein
MPIADYLRMNPWLDAHWDVADKPVMLVDGVIRRIREIGSPITGKAAYVVGVNQEGLYRICQHVNVRSLSFYEMRAADLSPLASISGLRDLAIRWNTKVRDIGPLQQLTLLEVLVLEDVPKVPDLSALTSLHSLRLLEFSGGIWTKNRVTTLAPLAICNDLNNCT